MSNLQDGIKAFKEGRRDEAREHFMNELRQNPKNENAWGWLYQVSRDNHERRVCLLRILEINPENEKVKQLLKQMEPGKIIPPTVAVPAQQTIPPARPAQKSNSNNMLLIIGAAAVLLIACCICGVIFYPTNGSSSILDTGHKVVYVVNGSAQSASITYANEQGGTEQVDVYLPWQKEFTVTSTTFLSIVAQSGGSGTLTCEIWYDDEKIKTSTSNAEYGVVTCSDWK